VMGKSDLSRRLYGFWCLSALKRWCRAKQNAGPGVQINIAD
jgi:hypothetical protein